ncbi:hypothetical protein MPER_07811, partial [Moniliophthora perniciosa FA553]
DLHRDRSSPFIAFDSDPITMMPPSMATPGSMASESSSRSLLGFYGSETNNVAAQSTSEAPTTVIEQTTSGSSTSITADSDSIPSGVKTSAGSITTDIDSTPNGTKIGSITSTGTTSTNVGQPTTFASSTDTRQPATSPSITSPAPSNAVSSGNDRSNSKAAIIAGSVIGGTLVLLAIIIPPYTLWCPIEKRPRKGIEESGQEEDEVGTTEARVEPAPHTGADRARQSIVVVHEDSGWRPDRALTPGNVRVVDLPPDYDAAQ